MNGVHEKLKPYQCEDCPFAASTKGNLQTYIKNVHLEIKYQCDKCSYSTAQSFNLKIDAKADHHKIKDFVCDVCDQHFSQNSHLKVHIHAVNAHMLLAKSMIWKSTSRQFTRRSKIWYEQSVRVPSVNDPILSNILEEST